MRIGIDFDNTIICYDKVFIELAKSWGLVEKNFIGNKKSLRDCLRKLPDGELIWQKLQGKVYGEFIAQAEIFPDVKAFITHAASKAELFIISHKTELGHFDSKKINLREAARQWLIQQDLCGKDDSISNQQIFFAETREEKIATITQLACTHFIDDLEEVLLAQDFPHHCQRILFQPAIENFSKHQDIKNFSNWIDIKHALFDYA